MRRIKLGSGRNCEEYFFFIFIKRKWVESSFIAALLAGFFNITQAAVLPPACFLSDGTLANATSGQLSLVNPITDVPRYKIPTTKKVVGLVCNPKKMQVLLRYEGGYKEKIWGSALVESGKVIVIDIPIEVRDGDYYYTNYTDSFFGVSGSNGVGRDISFSADGEFLAVNKSFGWDSRHFLSVFSSADLSEVASINMEKLLGEGGANKLLAVHAVSQNYVDVFATTRWSAHRYESGENIQSVRWYFREGRILKKLVGSDARGIYQGPGRGAFWDFHPLVGGFIGGNNGVITFFGSGEGDSMAYERFSSSGGKFPVSWGSWILGRNVGMTIGQRYAADGNTLIERCDNSDRSIRPYVFKIGERDFIPMPCGTLNPWGHIAIDVERGYIFNTSKGEPDRLIKVEDFSDVRKAYAESLQKKYSIFLRKGFVKAQQNERYVPSVSNTNSVSETLFYVNGQPVTRYKDHTITNEGYTEKFDLYNLVYEVRNDHSIPLAIMLRVEGRAKSTSWVVKTIGGWGKKDYVREKEDIVMPMKIEKTLILKSGETFKSKDVWGELPANEGEISIRTMDVQEVEPAWLDRLNDLLVGKAPPTRERIDEFLSDPRASWASEKLLLLHNKFQSEQNKQRMKRLLQNVKIVSVSIPKDYDPDFENKVTMELQNNSSEDIDVIVQVGAASVDATVSKKERKVISIIVTGVKKAEIAPSIKIAK